MTWTHHRPSPFTLAGDDRPVEVNGSQHIPNSDAQEHKSESGGDP
jgi:hypothetical protein